MSYDERDIFLFILNITSEYLQNYYRLVHNVKVSLYPYAMNKVLVFVYSRTRRNAYYVYV